MTALCLTRFLLRIRIFCEYTLLVYRLIFCLRWKRVRKPSWYGILPPHGSHSQSCRCLSVSNYALTRAKTCYKILLHRITTSVTQPLTMSWISIFISQFQVQKGAVDLPQPLIQTFFCTVKIFFDRHNALILFNISQDCDVLLL